MNNALRLASGAGIGAALAFAVGVNLLAYPTPAPVCAKAWAEQMGYTPIHVHCVNGFCSVRVAEPPWLVHLKCPSWGECVVRQP